MKQPLNKLSLEAFLEYKTLYYDKIDFSIVQNAWEILSKHVTLPYVIHLVGTNGKGTTGRFLAHYLNQSNQDVLHYTSPHILSFNERIWINGNDVDNEKLELAHEKLTTILPQESLEKLTYFEYTTLLALYLSSNRDYLVLEAGLGGEFDSTNVVENDLLLITTIGLDHTSFLGDTIEEIAKTKMRACDKTMMIGYQVEEHIKSYAQDVSESKEHSLTILEAKMDYDLTMFSYANYLKRNLCLALSVIEYLGFTVDLSKFDKLTFAGRCQQIRENITLDVGHNPLAATQLLEEFRNRGQKITLVYNALEDKDYEKVLSILKPIINTVEIIAIEDKRAAKPSDLTQVCDNLNIISTQFIGITTDKNYLVFGSFVVAETFLKFLLNKELNEK